MRVMDNHVFFDDDIKEVRWDGHKHNRSIHLNGNNDNMIIINKEDVIALAKQFDLAVFDRDKMY